MMQQIPATSARSWYLVYATKHDVDSVELKLYVSHTCKVMSISCMIGRNDGEENEPTIV